MEYLQGPDVELLTLLELLTHMIHNTHNTHNGITTLVSSNQEGLLHLPVIRKLRQAGVAGITP